MKHVAIIGNGISGVTLARALRKGDSSMRISLISAESPYFFSRTALMYVYMGHLKFEHTQPYENWFWEKNRIELIHARVDEVLPDVKQLRFSDGRTLNYDSLVLATGSKPNKFGWPGQDLKGVQGLYSYQDLQLLEENTHPALCRPSERKVNHAVIVGGGLIGVELAEMLLTRDIKVTFLIRESGFWGNVLGKEEGQLISKHLKHHGVNLVFETELKEIQGDRNGRVEAIIDSRGERIACQLLGLTAGVSPNVEFIRSSGIETDRGVLVDPYLRTNIDSVYAIGDCAQFRIAPEGRRSIEQVWYTGRMMGETLSKTILGKATLYQPGPWFNSAKFFDIEYQTYGTVSPDPQSDEARFFWKDDREETALSLVWERETGRFKGINVFGIRLRHEMFDRWLRNHASVYEVLENLKSANFDPELYRSFEGAILSEFNALNGTNLSPKRKNWKYILGMLKA